MASEILIVEDDRELARMCARALEGQGYVVRVAHDGVAAQQALSERVPGLVLLDLLLPKRDGRAVLQSVMQIETAPPIPVIMMSGLFKGRDLERSLEESGARGFLQKPFTEEDLVGEVRALLGAGTPAEAKGSSDTNRAQLSDVLLPEFLWRAMSLGRSGAVQFQRGKLHKVLVLEAGRPAGIRSNATSETFGRFLLERGRIDKDSYEESRRRLKEQNQRQGEALLDMGVLTAEQLAVELRAHAAAKLLELFSWGDGEAWFHEGRPRVGFASALEGWTPRLAILRGVKHVPAARIGVVLAAFAGCPVERTELRLDANEERIPALQALFAAMSKTSVVRELLNDHASALYGLWLIGAVRLSLRAEPARSTPATARPTPSAARPTAKLNDKKAQELEQALQELSAKTYYKLLEVSETASADDIQRAYVVLAKRYHPDRVALGSDAAKQISSDIFSLLSIARDTLCDPKKRASYDRTGGKDGAVDPVIQAEKMFREGESSLKRKDYPDALAKFDQARQLDPDEAEFHAAYGWAYFVVHRERDGERIGTASIEKAISLAPESAKGYYYLAQLHRACERADMAHKLFRKVLSIEPEHAEATQAVRLLKMRRDKQKASGAGLFGFGKKKGS